MTRMRFAFRRQRIIRLKQMIEILHHTALSSAPTLTHSKQESRVEREEDVLSTFVVIPNL